MGKLWHGWGQAHFGSQGMVTTESHLEVAVNEKVGLKIIIILSKGIDELFCYLSGQEGGK